MYKLYDLIFVYITKIASFTLVLILCSMFFVILNESELAFLEFGFDFLFDSRWAPNLNIFGAFPAIVGSILSTLIAMVIAIPLSLGIAVFLSEVAPRKIQNIIGTAIELLAAIPSIVYGMWGLFYFAPIIRNIFGGNGLGLLTAGFVLSIMIVPLIASISRDSMNTTPSILKESAYALGATKWDVIRSIVILYAKNGIFGAIILALGRAIGETMAVTFIIGNIHKTPNSIISATTTIPATLANEFNEADSELYYSSLFYLALILLFMSFIIIGVAKMYFLKKRVA